MKVILPFELSPIIRTYLNHAYPFGIVEGHFGKNFVSERMCDIYVNCLSLIHIFTLTDQEYQALKDINRYTKKTLKLTEVHNYASDGGNANAWSVYMVEKLLDIHIDFYAAVTFEGFREVIDAIGGIEFDVDVYKRQGIDSRGQLFHQTVHGNCLIHGVDDPVFFHAIVCVKA